MSRAAPLLQAQGLMLTLGGAPLFDGVDLSLARGERVCLVGANGAGKSTLLRLLARLIEPDRGTIALQGGVGVGYVPQDPDLAGHPSLLAYATAAFAGGGEIPAHRAEAELVALGLDPARPPEGLSGGETRRAALARAFAAEPDVLLLDEPTNHLDIPAIEALEGRLKARSGACLVISHDRRFLERVSSHTVWLRQGRTQRLDKGFAAFDAWAEQLEAEDERRLARLETHLRAEEHWLQRGVTARRSRNEGRRRKLLAMRAERRARVSLTAKPGLALEAARGAEGGQLVLEAKGLSFSYPSADGPRPIVTGLSLRLLRGDRIGIVGPNGAGKTTLLELLLEERAPDAGTVRRGAGVEMAYVDQSRGILDPNATVWEALCPTGGDQVMVRGRPRHVAAYAKDFLFTAAHLRQPIKALSGGERNRLTLAVALAKPVNLLVLDEPTNDLDMDSLEALEDMLTDYDGTVLIVSHDRAFLDGVTTQVLGALGGGRWAETPGGYEDFAREHGQPAPPVRAERPKAAPAPAPATAPAAPAKPRKLSYKDDRRAQELETLMPKLQADIAALEARLADPGLFARDAALYAATAARLDQTRAALDAAETEWLEIEEKRAALG